MKAIVTVLLVAVVVVAAGMLWVGDLFSEAEAKAAARAASQAASQAAVVAPAAKPAPVVSASAEISVYVRNTGDTVLHSCTVSLAGGGEGVWLTDELYPGSVRELSPAQLRWLGAAPGSQLVLSYCLTEAGDDRQAVLVAVPGTPPPAPKAVAAEPSPAPAPAPAQEAKASAPAAS